MRRPTLLAVLAALLLAACGGDDEEPASADRTSQAGQTAAGGGCREAEAPPAKRERKLKAPERRLEAGTTYEVTFETSCGSFTVRLDQRTSPRTAASFVSLVRKRFFDGTVFHRIVPGFVIQGGDPTATGSGGPGYSTRDVPPQGAAYTRGVVAMAKTEAEPPGTAGSQFYVVTGADAGLPPDYAILGKVVKGLDVTAEIENLGDPQSGGAGTPLQPVVLEKASVSER